MGKHLDYRQDECETVLERAKAECAFTEQLYEILLAHQEGRPLSGKPPGTPPGNVGDLNPAMSRLYNRVWSSVMSLQEKAKAKKKEQPNQMEVIA